MHTQTLRLDGQLAVRLDLPPDGPGPLGCAIIAHCFTCSTELNAVVNLSRALTREGLSVLRFDVTGLEEETTLLASVDDLVAAADLMAARGSPPVLLVGHSLGGAAAAVAAPRIPSLRGLATLGAPADGAQLLPSGDAGDAQVDLGGRPFSVSQRLVEQLGGVEDALRSSEVPLLVMHSPQDEDVPLAHATRLYLAARGPRSFVSLEGADHLLSRCEDADYAGRVIATWASRYLPDIPDPPLEDLAAQGRVVAVTQETGYRTAISVGKHRLIADEPVAVGGADSGPSPYDLLLAGLGACTGMTLRMYADRKEWPLQEVTVRLRHGKVHALDDQHPGDPEARVDHIQREIVLEGPLDEAQRTRLLEIANRCPVHKTLDAGVRTDTSLAAE